MNQHTYVSLPGQSSKEELFHWKHWVPAPQQILAILRLDLDEALDPFERRQVTVSMRQGLGLVVALGLIAGIIPLIANLWLGISMATAVPMAQAADNVAQLLRAYGGNVPLEIVGHTVQTVAGLEPQMPGLLAAVLSALGIWLNWPLSWIANWIVYGSAVCALARLMGGHHTLQTFFAATSFGAVPLLLTGLALIPIIGPLLGLAGIVWAFVIYFMAVRYVSQLDVGRTVLCVLLPGAVILFVPVVLLVVAAVLLVF